MNTNELSWNLLLPRVISYGIILRSSLKKLESELPKCPVMVLIFAPLPSLWILFPLYPSGSCYSSGHMATAAKAAPAFISQTNSTLFVSIKCTTAPFIVGSLRRAGHGEERLRGIPPMCINTCREGMKKRWPHIFQWCPMVGPGACILE